MDKMNSFKSNTDNELIKPAFINNEDGTVKVNYDNLEEKTRLSNFSPVLLKKKGTKLVFLYKDHKYAVDVESEESRENCKETLNNLGFGHTFNWFKEETGNKQCVLYDTDYFYAGKLGILKCLRYKENNAAGNKVIIPLNCSSCFHMFYNYQGRYLDLSHFDTTGITTMEGMFSTCSNLVKLDLSNFNTESVENMRYMFEDCSNLFLLDVSSFSTENVVNMECMFFECDSLEFLDLTSFDTASIESLYRMFYDCNSLQRIYVSPKWKLQEKVNGMGVFDWCTSLPRYNTEQVDAEMASPINPNGDTILYKILNSKKKPTGYLFLLK